MYCSFLPPFDEIVSSYNGFVATWFRPVIAPRYGLDQGVQTCAKDCGKSVRSDPLFSWLGPPRPMSSAMRPSLQTKAEMFLAQLENRKARPTPESVTPRLGSHSDRVYSMHLRKAAKLGGAPTRSLAGNTIMGRPLPTVLRPIPQIQDLMLHPCLLYTSPSPRDS